MAERVPDDTTLAEARLRLVDSGTIDPVLGLVKLSRSVRIRFVWADDLSDFPEDTTMGVFRRHCWARQARILIEDSDGGLRPRVPVPELTE